MHSASDIAVPTLLERLENACVMSRLATNLVEQRLPDNGKTLAFKRQRRVWDRKVYSFPCDLCLTARSRLM